MFASLRKMWLIVFFDLPVTSAEARRRATRFRQNLESDGYLRLQLSVYARPCNGPDDVQCHQRRLEQMLPERGNVRSLALSDLQFVRMKVLVGSPVPGEETGTSEWIVFGESQNISSP
jgi:CRISPR-associated protein Cas2